jgi:hypothetical protein
LSDARIIKLTVIAAPPSGPVVSAPPVLLAGSPSPVDHTCGRCETVLLKAAEGQVRNLQIRCTQCGSYNTTGV